MQAGIPAAFLGIELSVYVLFGWGLYASARRGRLDALTLLAACLLGFLAELVFATPLNDLPAWLPDFLRRAIANARTGSDDGYTYGSFLIMIAGIPLWVVLGWGSIIHACRRTSAALGFGAGVGALADGLLAASIDFVLDPVANGLGYWTWWIKGPADGVRSAFGVPLDNFLGWMMIVGGLSFTLRLACDACAKWNARLGIELVCLGVAIAAALAIVVVVQTIYDWLFAHVTPAGTFMLVYGIAAMLTVTRLPWLRRNAAIDIWTLSLVGYYHVYLIAMMLTHRLYERQSALLAFLPLMSLSSGVAFAWPSAARVLERWRARRPSVALDMAEAQTRPH